ncbi:MAG: peptidoglycan bridge formation glycyltransferase FemA/FemB family protein [Bacteroidetes bacterium]|nr:peptidoglycan bridge formation glycyltransferase FemA/FemB family protein [Bacteroidota bacterium]
MMEVRSVLTGRRGVSLPFSDYCEPIVLDKTQFQALFTNVISYAKNSRWKSLELRSGRKFFGDIPSSAYFYRHTLDLTRGEEEIFASFQSSTKRNIRKSIRKDVKVEVCNSMNPIKEFYRLNCMTRKNHGIPPQPFSFFKKTYEHIISQNMGIVVLASYENKIIAGAIYFHFGKKAIYKYGASDKTYQNLRPNDLVMWEAIRWYSQNGFDNLCFGKTEPKHEGLRKFKLGWGTKEETLRYFKYDLRQETFVSNSDLVTGAHNKIFSRMPIPMSKILGSVLYKHFG